MYADSYHYNILYLKLVLIINQKFIPLTHGFIHKERAARLIGLEISLQTDSIKLDYSSAPVSSVKSY